MYLDYFGLKKHPFSSLPDPNFLYLSTSHREALARLLYAVTSPKGIFVLSGNPGTGKTTLLRTMLDRIPPAMAQFSFVAHPALTPAEFLRSTMLDFGLSNIPASRGRRVKLFGEFLARSTGHGRRLVLVLDDAHKLSAGLLNEIRLLMNARTAEQNLLQVILAGQEDSAHPLAHDGSGQFDRLIAARVEIGPLSRTDVGEYMQTRWSRAAAKEEFPFHADAATAVALYSRGVPRFINALAEAALMNAYTANKKLIQACDIQAAAQSPVRSPIDSPPGARQVDPQEQNRPATPMLVQYPSRKARSAPRLRRWATRLGVVRG